MTVSPLVKYPDKQIVLPPTYCGSIYYYAAMAQFGGVKIDTERRFNKREKDCHRCTISGPNGLQRLTVPLEKPQEWHSTKLSDVKVSRHGEWWHVHRVAIESAYGRTPFFEYYADEIMPAFTGNIELLVDLDAIIDRFCRSALGITAATDNSLEIVTNLPAVHDVDYYQIWAARFGFTPGLSALDLIFNMGNEAPLVLREMIR